jgi:hypothetical protein
MAYILVFAPTVTSLEEMVEAFGGRWTVEQCFEEGKGEVGLDEYEIRSWHGWYRHQTLSMLALAFLAALRANESDDASKKTEQLLQAPMPDEAVVFDHVRGPSDLLVMVPLSIPEIRRLFFRLVGKPPRSFAYYLAWSFWRRAHQALARLYHSKHRNTLVGYLQLIDSLVERRDHLSEMESCSTGGAQRESRRDNVRPRLPWRESDRLRKPAPRPSGSPASIGRGTQHLDAFRKTADPR